MGFNTGLCTRRCGVVTAHLAAIKIVHLNLGHPQYFTCSGAWCIAIILFHVILDQTICGAHYINFFMLTNQAAGFKAKAHLMCLVTLQLCTHACYFI